MSVASIMCAPVNSSLPSYTRPLLEIEKNFDLCEFFTWQTSNWQMIYSFIGVYLVVIFGGREYMKSRPPFQLRGVLFLWNVALACFSIVSSWRMVTSLLYITQRYGFLFSACSIDPQEYRQSVGLWMFLYLLSKVVEFGDTVFIVLRKTPLLFLHWYHHVTVAFMVWSTGAYASPIHVHFCTVNLLVHSVMYSYYALKVLGVKVPRRISMAITSLQLLQMVVGVYITVYAYRAKARGHACAVSDQAVAIAATIYLSYFALFLNFFVKVYVPKRKPVDDCNGQFKKAA